MSKLIALMIFLIHVFSCVWFYTSKANAFYPGTWVFNRGMLDMTPFEQYIVSVYWACQTVTTVGYGDICSSIFAEFYVVIIWMLVGTFQYAFTVGNMTGIIASADDKAAGLQKKIQVLEVYAKRIEMPTLTFMRITRFLENDIEDLNSL